MILATSCQKLIALRHVNKMWVISFSTVACIIEMEHGSEIETSVMEVLPSRESMIMEKPNRILDFIWGIDFPNPLEFLCTFSIIQVMGFSIE